MTATRKWWEPMTKEEVLNSVTENMRAKAIKELAEGSKAVRLINYDNNHSCTTKSVTAVMMISEEATEQDIIDAITMNNFGGSVQSKTARGDGTVLVEARVYVD